MRLLLVLILSCSTTNFAQRLEKSCCRLDLSIFEVPARLQIVLTNLNPEPVRTARWVAEEYNLRIQIRDNNGSEPKRTDFGKGVLLPPQGSRLRDPILKQGETLTAVLDVRKQYVLTTGTYTVTVSRDVFLDKKKIELQAKTTIRIP